MRTTIDISDDVLRRLKRLAAESHRTLRDAAEDTLRAGLARCRSAPRREDGRAVLTYKGRGLKPGVSLDSTAELLDVMDRRR